MTLKLTQLIIITLLFSSAAYAQNTPFKVSCEITPAIWELTSWPPVSKSNNLRRLTGSATIAQGEQIFLQGKITDSSCVPVAGAIVEIWQADHKGIMKGFAKNNHMENPEFKYTGIAITDNFGDYNFITLFPGALEDKAPFVKFRVKHQNFMPMETVMFFENQAYNSSDHVLKNEVKASKRHLLIAKIEKINKDDGESIKYQFDITLEGKNKYLKY